MPPAPAPDALNLEELAELPTLMRAHAARSCRLDQELYTLLMKGAHSIELARLELLGHRYPAAQPRRGWRHLFGLGRGVSG